MVTEQVYRPVDFEKSYQSPFGNALMIMSFEFLKFQDSAIIIFLNCSCLEHWVQKFHDDQIFASHWPRCLYVTSLKLHLCLPWTY